MVSVDPVADTKHMVVSCERITILVMVPSQRIAHFATALRLAASDPTAPGWQAAHTTKPQGSLANTLVSSDEDSVGEYGIPRSVVHASQNMFTAVWNFIHKLAEPIPCSSDPRWIPRRRQYHLILIRIFHCSVSTYQCISHDAIKPCS